MAKSKKSSFHGRLNDLASAKVPALSGMGKTSLTLKKGQLLTPHSHPNANELAYFNSGTAEVGIIDPALALKGVKIKPFKVSKGDIVFFSAGIHSLRPEHR